LQGEKPLQNLSQGAIVLDNQDLLHWPDRSSNVGLFKVAAKMVAAINLFLSAGSPLDSRSEITGRFVEDSLPCCETNQLELQLFSGRNKRVLIDLLETDLAVRSGTLSSVSR
jgi:hypothetical protein